MNFIDTVDLPVLSPAAKQDLGSAFPLKEMKADTCSFSDGEAPTGLGSHFTKLTWALSVS